MELFVHPGFVSKGIGKCLVDRLLEMVDTSYRARGGYEYVNDDTYLKTGPARVIKTILLNVQHENGEDLEANWRGKFLNACKFFRVGRFPKVGYKNDKVLDTSIFAHQTKEDIDPSARPTVAG
jgi:GNAT superfamily N-acetyltransferase